MRWIEIEGDAFEIGVQLGRLAGDAFDNVLVRIQRFCEVVDEFSDSPRLRALEKAARNAFPEHMREIDGIAKGAEVSFDTAFAWNCRGDFPGGGDQSALAGCTDIMVKTVNGQRAWMAHNEDDQPELDGECFIVHVRPRSGPAFTSFYSPGLLPGHTFGWNDAGLVQTINHLRSHDQQIGVPRHVLCRAILSCSNLHAAQALIRATTRAGGFHHNLGFATDKPILLSIEAPACALAEVEVTDFHAHANHLIAPSLKTIAQTIAPSSAARQSRANALVRHDVDSVEQVISVLADQLNTDWPIRRKGLSSADPGFTLASCVFELTPHRIDWRIYHDPIASPVFIGTTLAPQC